MCVDGRSMNVIKFEGTSEKSRCNWPVGELDSHDAKACLDQFIPNHRPTTLEKTNRLTILALSFEKC